MHTVNPRISPRGLIVNFEILHGGLIEGGGLFEEGGLLKIIYFWMGANSKWQVDLQDTIDAQAFNAENRDISRFGAPCNPWCDSKRPSIIFHSLWNFLTLKIYEFQSYFTINCCFHLPPRGLFNTVSFSSFSWISIKPPGGLFEGGGLL